MANINLNIINNGVAKGTLGFLAKNAASILLGNQKPLFKGDQTRAAWLLDHDGNTITWLCASDSGTLADQPEWFTDWTKAARNTLENIIDLAQDLLENQDADVPKLTFTVSKNS